MKNLWNKLKCGSRYVLMTALAASLMLPAGAGVGLVSQAAYVDTNLNTFVHDPAQPQYGYVGQQMQFTVRVGYNGANGLSNPPTDSINDVIVRLSNDQNYLAKPTDPGQDKGNPYNKEDENEEELYDAWNEGKQAGINKAYGAELTYPVDSGSYPFEVNASTFSQEHRIDSLKKGEYRELSFNVKIKEDAAEGYYGIPVTFYYKLPNMNYAEGKRPAKVEFINVYIKKSGEVQVPGSVTQDKSFAVGEGQETPMGSAGSVMNFAVNFKNRKQSKMYDLRVHLNMSLAKDVEVQKTAAAKAAATTGFPFNINEANYDRVCGQLDSGETFEAPYSMAIMQAAASAYYPLSFTLSYKLTPGATVSYTEDYVFYVRISNPAMEDSESQLGDFNANDREKARLVVEAYQTVPEKVMAGQPFMLSIRMKNASDKIAASNILFSLESEKADNSTVFSTDSGSNSIAVSSLKAGESTTLQMSMTAAPGVEQRSYSITINEKYDSPEFKNAEEKVSIDIPVYQIMRLSASNFEMMPEALEVGKDGNLTFNINNTGKAVIYNVEAEFVADSLKSENGYPKAYVGNIKPGESASVDTMLTAVAPSMDDGSVKVVLHYEDVNGEPYSEDASMKLMVTESMPENPEDVMTPEDMDMHADQPSPWLLGGGALAALALIAGGIYLLRRRKRKREQEMED